MRIVERSPIQGILITESEEETREVGAALGSILQPGDVVALHGDLGAGKTRFVQGIARGMGIDRQVTSPTFILMNVYRARNGRVLCHVDCYRLHDPVEAGYELGLDQQLRGDDICVVEWAERIRSLLPPDHLWVDLAILDDDRRRLVFSPHGPHSRERWQAFLRRLEWMSHGPGAGRGV